MINWVAYCTNCQEQLDESTNGVEVEKTASEHAKEAEHQVLVGYYVEPEES